MRTFWQETIVESMGGAAWLGVGAVAALLLVPSFRRQAADWGRGLGEEFRSVWHDSRSRAGLLSGAAAVAAAGATLAAGTAAVAAPEASLPAAAAVAAVPAAAISIPVALAGITNAADAKDAVERLLKQPEDGPGDVH